MLTTMSLKQILDDFLSKLQRGVKSQIVQTEADLVQLFRVETEQERRVRELYGTPKTPTLLEHLGYSSGDVDERPVERTVVGQIRYAPDYILQPNQQRLAIMDLKAPGQSLDHERWVAQITTYCRELKVPLGILFNGIELRVFINTDYKGLVKHKKLFLQQPVASAGSHERKQMVDILLRFALPTLQASATVVANNLASKRRHELRDRERQHVIQNQLATVLANPPKPVFAALASVDGIWDEIEPKPSEAELTSAWAATLAAAEKSKRVKTMPEPQRPRRSIRKSA